MKIKATFKGETQEFLTDDIRIYILPALGHDGRLYFSLNPNAMGEFTRIATLNGENGFLSDDHMFCFVLLTDKDNEPIETSSHTIVDEIWDKCNSIEEYLDALREYKSKVS